MYQLARRLLFHLSAENAHNLSMDILGAWGRLGLNRLLPQHVPSQPVTVMGLKFANPVGLAAGMDKNGEAINGLGSLGFGFMELGTVTPKPQPGNPKPRVFRLVDQHAIINRMGFNNLGVDHLVNSIKRSNYKGVLGISIGKNLTTSVENAQDDYITCFHKVYNYADYIAFNFSSPNTPGLRTLQFGDTLKTLLETLKQEQHKLQQMHGKYVPVTVKIAPDMTQEDIAEVAKILLSQGVDGVIATNTTVSREKIEGHEQAKEAGGLSGAPLTDKSTEIIQLLSSELSGKLPIIGVGGIMDAQGAADKINAGASLIQLYSGFIFKGPALIRETAEACYACRKHA